MKKNLLRMGILLMLGILVIGIALPAMAGVTGSGNQQGKQQGLNNGVCTFQGNMKGSGQGMQSQTMLKAVAELSGLNTEKIRENRQAGQSLLSIAKTNGVDETTLINKITTTNQARLKERLDAGSIDQAQYDSCLAQMNERIKERLNRSETGNANAGSGRGNRQGGMGRCQQI
ncbi:MAG: hypothetical protein PHX14_07895 [Syntrophomonadaceae bacterium]|nr:hypothetical protein [Syntrophomonadaceae bacterium]